MLNVRALAMWCVLAAITTACTSGTDYGCDFPIACVDHCGGPTVKMVCNGTCDAPLIRACAPDAASDAVAPSDAASDVSIDANASDASADAPDGG